MASIFIALKNVLRLTKKESIYCHFIFLYFLGVWYHLLPLRVSRGIAIIKGRQQNDGVESKPGESTKFISDYFNYWKTTEGRIPHKRGSGEHPGRAQKEMRCFSWCRDERYLSERCSCSPAGFLTGCDWLVWALGNFGWGSPFPPGRRLMASRYFSSPFPRDGSKDQGAAGPSGCPSFCQHCGWPASYGTELEGKSECFFSMASPVFSLSIQLRSRERKQKHSHEETCEIQELAGSFLLASFPLFSGASPNYRRRGCESPGPGQPAREHVPAPSPAVNSSTGWQWVRWSHMPIFGTRHKVPDCNICLGDKWRKRFERANRNKKARSCANSQERSLGGSIYHSCII